VPGTAAVSYIESRIFYILLIRSKAVSISISPVVSRIVVLLLIRVLSKAIVAALYKVILRTVRLGS